MMMSGLCLDLHGHKRSSSFPVRMLKKSIIILTILLTDITGNGIDDSIKANDDIWTRINAEYIIADNMDILGRRRRLSLGDFMYMEETSCYNVLQYIRDNAINLVNTMVEEHNNFTAGCGLYYLLDDAQLLPPSSNNYHWWISRHINNMINDINTHYTTLAAVIASNPDCIPLSIRRVFAHYIAEYRLVMKDVTQLIWATYIFGIYGDIVEGDIDDDVNSKTGKKSSGDTNPLPSDPSSFAAWTKDTTFAVMLSARIAKYVEDYVSSIDPALISLIISHNNNTDDGRPHPSYRAVQYYYHTK
ncbi:hypothetical protein FOZ60_008521 [Perkinsus olseni]|uniref:Uncharacterized protein n=1 Tax=Perkinsus olseni TaxID=32597 RepID=A0A7J6NJN1_PEROL|nr:hypothetical protein FOZ60_008521 [Perkinsus olseni]